MFLFAEQGPKRNHLPAMQPTRNSAAMTRPNSVRIRAFGPLDLLIVAILALFAVGSMSVLRESEPAEFVVYRDDTILATYPLTEDRTVVVDGAMGKVMMEVSDGAVRIVRSPCPRQICVLSGPIDTPGQQLICVPNHIIIEIAGRSPATDPDAIAH